LSVLPTRDSAKGCEQREVKRTTQRKEGIGADMREDETRFAALQGQGKRKGGRRGVTALPRLSNKTGTGKRGEGKSRVNMGRKDLTTMLKYLRI